MRLALGVVEHQHAAVGEIVGALEGLARAGRPGHRRDVERQGRGDLVEQLDRVPGLAVHLVDEGDDRHVAQAADLEQLAGARLDALGGVDHHHRRIDGGQGAIGVLAEILVARRVEQVEDRAAILEMHHRGGDRDAALLLDLHPVRARAPGLAARLHRTRDMDRAAEQQQLLGQRGLAGVGMRDDGERAPQPGGMAGQAGVGLSSEKAVSGTIYSLIPGRTGARVGAHAARHRRRLATSTRVLLQLLAQHLESPAIRSRRFEFGLGRRSRAVPAWKAVGSRR